MFADTKCCNQFPSVLQATEKWKDTTKYVGKKFDLRKEFFFSWQRRVHFFPHQKMVFLDKNHLIRSSRLRAELPKLKNVTERKRNIIRLIWKWGGKSGTVSFSSAYFKLKFSTRRTIFHFSLFICTLCSAPSFDIYVYEYEHKHTHIA